MWFCLAKTHSSAGSTSSNEGSVCIEDNEQARASTRTRPSPFGSSHRNATQKRLRRHERRETVENWIYVRYSGTDRTDKTDRTDGTALFI